MNYTAKRFAKHVAAFSAWLTARGAQVLAVTNEWEVCRFVTSRGTSIIYKKKNDVMTFVNESHEAYTAFLSNASWRAMPPSKRKAKSSPICKTLRERDGDNCFYCRKPVEVEDESIEHLVPITHGGPDHIANMVLAHRAPCNAQAGHLSVMEKIRLREENAKPISTPPWEETT